MSFASCTAGVGRPMSGGVPPAWDVLKNVGSTRSKSRSARMRSSSTEPTMPRHPMMPIFVMTG